MANCSFAQRSTFGVFRSNRNVRRGRTYWFRAGNKYLPGISNRIAGFVTQRYFNDRTKKPELTHDNELTIQKALKEDALSSDILEVF